MGIKTPNSWIINVFVSLQENGFVGDIFVCFATPFIMPVHDHAKRVQNPSPPCLPPQPIDQFIQLVGDGLHLALCRRIAHAEAERAYGVSVVARAADGAVELCIRLVKPCLRLS